MQPDSELREDSAVNKNVGPATSFRGVLLGEVVEYVRDFDDVNGIEIAREVVSGSGKVEVPTPGVTPAHQFPSETPPGQPPQDSGEKFLPGTSQGHVKFFDDPKGFGFIATNEGEEVFFHRKNFAGVATLNDGDKVSFDLSFDHVRNKKIATNVRHADGGPSMSAPMPAQDGKREK